MALLAAIATVFLYAFSLVGETLESCIVADSIRRGNPARAARHLSATAGADAADDPLAQHHAFIAGLNYVSLAELSFGTAGAVLVSLSLTCEMFLALVSFHINVGLNLQAVCPSLDVAWGILLSAACTVLLALCDLKYASYASALGTALTLLLLVALVLSGMQLPRTAVTFDWFGTDASSTGAAVSHAVAVAATAPLTKGQTAVRTYRALVPSHVPFALGLIAFCFGGIGAVPQMYTRMANRHLYTTALHTAGAAIFSLYLLIMGLGYFFYAQYTQVPVSLNIGHDLMGQDMQNGAFLRWLSAIGILFNIQVTCPLLTFPIRDILAGTVAVAAAAAKPYWCWRWQSGDAVGGTVKGSDGDDCEGDVGLDLTPNDDDDALPQARAPSPSVAEPPKPSPSLLTACTIVTVAAAAATGLLLRDHFSNICSIVGGVVTMFNSLLLPIAFFHRLSHRRSSLARITAHAGIAMLALVTAVVGAGGNMCSIFWGGKEGGGICAYIASH